MKTNHHITRHWAWRLSQLILTAVLVCRALGAYAYLHPGVPLTVRDLDIVKSKIQNNESPWSTGYAALAADGKSSAYYTRQGPFATVSRNPDVNLAAWRNDMQSVWQQSLMWYFTGNSIYGQAAHDTLLAWANTQTSFGGIESVLDLGDYAYAWAGAASILRGTWPGWTSADTTAVKNLFNNVYWPAAGCVGNTIGPANKGSLALAASTAIAAFCDDTAKMNKCLYLLRTSGPGGFPNTLPSGEVGETGRDQGHAAGEWGMLAFAAEVMYKQGIDVYSHLDNRLLAAGEYFSRFNSGVSTPFIPYGTSDQFYAATPTSTWSGGMPGLNLVYSAYCVRNGLSSPYLKMRRDSSPIGINDFVFYKPGDSITASAPAAQPFPTATLVGAGGFTGVDINCSPAGSQSFSANVWTVSGAGTNIYTHGPDSCHFAYKQVTGDCSIIAKLNTMQGTSGYQSIGVMIRNSLSPTAASRAAVSLKPGNLAETFMHGWTDVYGGVNWEAKRQAIPSQYYWLKLERINNDIGLYISEDGASWAAIGYGQFGNLPSTAYIGLVVCSAVSGTVNTSSFANVSVTGGSGGTVTAPAAPYAVLASPGVGQVALRWYASFGATSYAVIRSTAANGIYSTIGTTANCSFVDTGVTPGTTYYYKITAQNSAGSNYSSYDSATPTAPVLASGTYKVINRNAAQSGLTTAGAGTANGTGLTISTYSGANYQRWTFTHVGDDVYTITGVASGKLVDLPNFSITDGAQYNIWQANGQPSQRYKVTATDSGYYKLINMMDGKCMDVSGSGTANGTPVVQLPYNGGANEQWLIAAP